jgi:hypothetical protein
LLLIYSNKWEASLIYFGENLQIILGEEDKVYPLLYAFNTRHDYRSFALQTFY